METDRPDVARAEPRGNQLELLAIVVFVVLLLATMLSLIGSSPAPVGRRLAAGAAVLGLVGMARRLALLSGACSGAQLRHVRDELGLRLPTSHRASWLVLWPTVALPLSVGASLAATALLGSAGAPAVADPRAGLVYAAGWGGGLLTVWLSAAMAEELLFRGLLLLLVARMTARRRRPVLVVAVLVGTSVAFGLWHWSYGMSNVLSVTVDGLVYGVLALRSRSLVPAVLAHGFYDSGWAITLLLLHS
jgi:membrane protease YdiL (CAAX protease family)